MENQTIHIDNHAEHIGIPFRYMTQDENKQMDEIAKQSYHKPKYLNALKLTTQLEVRQYCCEHPNALAKEVLIKIMENYSTTIPSSILAEMAQIIINEWEMIQISKQELALI